jgi:prophage regulatory protein
LFRSARRPPLVACFSCNSTNSQETTVGQANSIQKVGDPILRFRDVEQATGLSRTTIWRERLAGRFPKPVRLTATLCGWRASDITAWIEGRPDIASEQMKRSRATPRSSLDPPEPLAEQLVLGATGRNRRASRRR